mmetsp:Transcript_6709/g.13102  ORF Transcript_6709/g.13102 Transcript_6709/m.13102 type:complete len:246 (+) Transcript_6709:426-1163(+)
MDSPKSPKLSSVDTGGPASLSISSLVQVVFLRYKRKRQAEKLRSIRYQESFDPDMYKMETTTTFDADEDFTAEAPPESFALSPRRDAALRSEVTFRKSDADTGISRANLKAAQDLVRNSADTDFPYLHDWRWEAIAGVARNVVVGKGDLVFTDGRGRFAVVKLGVSSASASDVNEESTRDRQLKAQSLRYARIYERLHPHATSVVPMLMTNDGLLMYEEGEWSMHRENPTRIGVATSLGWLCCVY